MPAHTLVSVQIGSLTIPSPGFDLTREGLGEPSTTQDRLYATSPFVHGSYLVLTRLEQTSVRLGVQISGTTVANLLTNLATLRAAINTYSYNLVVIIGGNSRTFAADAGDMALLGEAWQDDRLALIHQRTQLTIPVHPVAVV